MILLRAIEGFANSSRARIARHCTAGDQFTRQAPIVIATSRAGAGTTE
jgi:hypothetical protein